jgi:hypothetical protein
LTEDWLKNLFIRQAKLSAIIWKSISPDSLMSLLKQLAAGCWLLADSFKPTISLKILILSLNVLFSHQIKAGRFQPAASRQQPAARKQDSSPSQLFAVCVI